MSALPGISRRLLDRKLPKTTGREGRLAYKGRLGRSGRAARKYLKAGRALAAVQALGEATKILQRNLCLKCWIGLSRRSLRHPPRSMET